MDFSSPGVPPLKSALFVDFDNIYIGLSKTDPQAAERFASDPGRWLAWLESGLPNRTGSPNGVLRQRSILIRRCYPNPDAGFRRFRSFFTSAAFSVIDCPSMTRAGKNSADIYMVMDLLDTLNHRTNFDEFIIFSGDSDFMPVLLRLRAHDRRTTSLAIDFMPPAFRAACDLVISEEEFIEDALGISNDGNCAENGMGRARVSAGVMKEMTARVLDAVSAEGEVAGADLPDILKDFRAFRESNNWLGFGTSQRLAEALICSEPRLVVVRLNPTMYKIAIKPTVVEPEITPLSRKAKPAEKVAVAAKVQPVENENGSGAREGRKAEKVSKSDLAQLRARVIEAVQQLAASSTAPILLARASQHVVSKLGPQVLDTQWAGTGSFKKLLQSAANLGLEITTQPEPGYIFDPHRHTHPLNTRGGDLPGEPVALEPTASADVAQPGAEGAAAEAAISADLPYPIAEEEQPYEPDEVEIEAAFEESPPTLEEFARRVSQVTGAPDWTQRQYGTVFRGIFHELQQIAAGEKVYSTYQSSKAVSDWCAEQGEQVARSDVVSIFKGIIFQDGVRFGKRPGSYTAFELASVVRENIAALCRRSRMELTDYEEHLLDEWIRGDLEEEMAAAGENNAGFSAHDPESPLSQA